MTIFFYISCAYLLLKWHKERRLKSLNVFLISYHCIVHCMIATMIIKRDQISKPSFLVCIHTKVHWLTILTEFCILLQLSSDAIPIWRCDVLQAGQFHILESVVVICSFLCDICYLCHCCGCSGWSIQKDGKDLIISLRLQPILDIILIFTLWSCYL